LRGAPAWQGAALARQAYGDVVDRAANAAAQKLLGSAAYRRRCVSALNVTDSKRLASGLARLAATDWTKQPGKRRGPRSGSNR